MKPHKHAELIKAWADGAEIEARYLKADGWTEWKKEEGGFIWYVSGAEYRIKPDPKPDIVRYTQVSLSSTDIFFYKQYPADNVKLTFDGETGELKSAEVIK
jgi:hypothetical protein